MKHKLEITQSETGNVYLTIYEVIVKSANGRYDVYQRYMSEDRAENCATWLRKSKFEGYETAFTQAQCVFL